MSHNFILHMTSMKAFSDARRPVVTCCVCLSLCCYFAACAPSTPYRLSHERLTTSKSVKWPVVSGLKLQSYYTLPTHNGDNVPLVALYGTNVSTQDLYVATQPPYSEGSGRQSFFVLAKWDTLHYAPSTEGYRSCIPPESDLRIARLAPRETALLASYVLPDQRDLDHSNTYARYFVSEEFGKRFGIWHGEVVSPLIPYPTSLLPSGATHMSSKAP